jgi:type III pantothenate kinase
MKLLVDIGNTSVKWALLDPAAGAGSDEPRHFGAARHGGGLPLDLLAIWDELDGVTRVTAAGVGPESVKDAVRHVCAARWASQPAWVETRAESDGVRIAYREPARLGVDRFLALIAAHRAARGTDHAGRPSLIIDAGTAITYDLLLANGTHLGGLILPGLGMMRDSLLAGTQIPPQASADAEVPWADDTAAAIAAGGLHAAGALAERLYQQLRDVDAGAGREPRLWLTGGDAERLASVIGPPVDQVPDLVLRGLAAFA